MLLALEEVKSCCRTIGVRWASLVQPSSRITPEQVSGGDAIRAHQSGWYQPLMLDGQRLLLLAPALSNTAIVR